jgi:outer membrane biosynthesis protein TonB
MVRPSARPDSLRTSRPETERLLVALLISLLLHLGAWGGYQSGKKLGWWQHLPTLAWWHKPENKSFPLQPVPPKQAKNEPATFIDVVIEDPVPPTEAQYYSSKNSRAANPDADLAANQPKLNGKQKDVPQTEDAPKQSKLQPSPPAPQPPVAQTGQKTEPSDALELPPGDLNPRKKKSGDSSAQNQPKQPPQPERPRTLKQAQRSLPLPGMQMQQAGGVTRWGQARLDAKATQFGEYDSAIVAAVTQHWYDLLESQQFAMDRTGRVTLQFRLFSDGRITEMKTQDNSVGPTLGYVCQEAIEQSAPFAKWPPDMIRMIGENYRDISFTFYYY